MEVKKIMCCCGNGLGSSMIIRITVEEVLETLGRTDVEVTQGSLSDAVYGVADLFIVCSDLQEFVLGLPQVIALDDVMSVEEVARKLIEYF